MRLLPDCECQIPPPVLLATRRREADALAVIFLPWTPLGRSANVALRKHWAKNLEEHEPAQLAALWGHRAADDPRLEEPCDVYVLVIRREAVPLDDDNLYLALKPVRDALISLKMLPQDTPGWWLYRGVEQITYPMHYGWTVMFFLPRTPILKVDEAHL